MGTRGAAYCNGAATGGYGVVIDAEAEGCIGAFVGIGRAAAADNVLALAYE